VGNILLRNEAGYNLYKIPKMPLDICVADSQGGIGYMIERQLVNVLKENRIRRSVVTMVTQVLVDIHDPAFKQPTKPIGPFYLKEEADLLSRVNNWAFREDAKKRGWRRIVPSPKPIDIMNKRIIKKLAKAGVIVITAGGGGIPVFINDKKLRGAEAVIDKDLAASLLASKIGADTLIFLTDVPKVYLNYNKPDQKPLDLLTIAEAEKYFNSGEFPSGSMGPKISAAIEFIKKGGKETFITDAHKLLDPSAGTRIC
jgi:carbamate kinase